jgi:protein prenyltransferase alpha subunit repeat containing protein 1
MTALNARKRLIQRQLLDSKKELEYTAALLSSRNCANQSILWHHRQWLLRRIYGCFNNILPPNQTDKTLPCPETVLDMEVLSGISTREMIANELSIASKACEIYPRNYFAWSHRHMCIQVVIDIVSSATNPTYVEDLVLLILEEVTTVRRWVEQHISDSSAVHYLVTLLERLSSDVGPIPFALANPEDRMASGCVGFSSSMSHVMSLVQSYPDHESLWLYLRAVLSGQGEAQRNDVQRFTNSFIYPWAGQKLLPSGYDPKLVTIHAYRFLAWQASRVSPLLMPIYIYTNVTMEHVTEYNF